MFRREMPRVYELRDLIEDQSDPRACFANFDKYIIDKDPSLDSMKQAWLAYEREFQRLDAVSWKNLKDEARPYLTAFDTKGRGQQQLISILNQARAYNYLIDLGCSRLCFIPRAKKMGQETPDLEGELNGRKVLCEVKTIQPSKDEVNRQQEGDVDSTTNLLDEKFIYDKLKPTLCKAKSQMKSYDNSDEVKCVAFMVVNFDDFLGEYKAEYFAQIDRWLAADLFPGIEIVFYNQRTPFNQHVSMSHAHVINEPIQC
ncbi:MAG TPA: hypothetical protein VK138_01110 [Acidiferrobacterales bacterium]|nr:hypothetical protein [Acidiferrobacterales bacterium]